MIATVDEKDSLIQLLGEIHDNVAKDCISYFQRYRLVFVILFEIGTCKKKINTIDVRTILLYVYKL